MAARVTDQEDGTGTDEVGLLNALSAFADRWGAADYFFDLNNDPPAVATRLREWAEEIEQH